jgi:hypothetical protein
VDRVGLLLFALCVGAPRPAAAIPLGRVALRAAELRIVDAHGARRVPITLVPSIGCPEGERCLEATAVDRDLEVRVHLGPGKRALPFTIEANARRATSAREIVVRLVFDAASVSVLGRDHRLQKPRRAVLERFDPKWIDLGGAVLIVDDDVDDVTVSASPGLATIDLELLSAPARPFGHLPRIGRNWRDIKGRVPVPERYLAGGDALAAHGELVLGELAPLALSPWPAGRKAAFVITDHADQSSGATLHALLGGASDADLEHPSAGLLGHHLPITKALFQRGLLPHGGARAQLEDAAFAALAEQARAAGVELAPHSATPVSDDRAVTDATLTWFAERGSHVWIDHQPQTNREGFCQTGWHSRTGIADLLEAHAFCDVWDLSEWTGEGLDERDPRHPDRHAPFLWPLGRLEPGGPASLWMFRSTWAFVPTDKFFARYGEGALDQLERDRGVQIAHTYLETLHPRRTFLGRRNVMLRDARGVIRLDPRLEALFASLEQRSHRGSLWVTPLGALAERLRAFGSVRVRITDAGGVTVTRPALLDDVTLTVAGAPALHGEGVVAQRSDAGELSAWLARCIEPAPSCTSELTIEPPLLR